jgi:hypothetical protein
MKKGMLLASVVAVIIAVIGFLAYGLHMNKRSDCESCCNDENKE